MPNGTVSPSVKAQGAFFQWLERQYGWQAWVIKQMIGNPPWYEGQNKYYDYWLQAGKPNEKIATAPTVSQWQPEGLKQGEGSFAGTMPEAYQRPYAKATPEGTQAQAEPKPVPGYTWAPQYDLEGNVVTWELVPERLPAGELSPYEQWQMGESQRGQRQTEREWMWKRYEKQQDVRQAQYQEAAQRWAAEAGRPRQEVDLSEKARIWASAQRELLSQYDPDRDFTRRFQIQNMRNPYAGGPESNIDMAAEDVERAEQEYKYWHTKANQIRSRYADPNDPLYVGSATETPSAEQWYASRVLSVEQTAKNKLLEFEGTLAEESEGLAGMYAEGIPTSSGGRAYGEVSSEPPRPWHPKTPTFLSRMYPEKGERELWGEKGGWRPKVAVPSGQAWNRLLPSERQQWMGYTEHWLGQKPLDLLQSTAKMLPQQPRIATSWRPAMQRT